MVPESLNHNNSEQKVAEINPLASKLHHSIESEYQLPFNKTATMDSHSVHAEALSEKLQQLKQEQQLGQQPNGRHLHHASSSASHRLHHHKRDEHSSSSDKKTPHDALQEILVRIEKQHHDKELERDELEAEALRRHNHRRLSPDLLKGHLHHTLSQNHGNANLRHS